MKISFRKLNKSKGGAELCQDAMRAPTHEFEVKGKKVRRMVIEATATWLSLKLPCKYPLKSPFNALLEILSKAPEFPEPNLATSHKS